MSDEYKPPFTITEKITNLVVDIAEMTGAIALSSALSRNPTLRRENRIHSIHSSLAIERNSLTLDQVSDIIDGKRVLGPPQDIREVQNAYEAYEMMTKLNPYRIMDLLRAHKIMMSDLVKESGIFRSKGVGVYAGMDLIQNVDEKSENSELLPSDKLLKLLRQDGTRSAKDMAAQLEMSDRQIQRLLKTLKDNGRIERTGSNRKGLWKVL